MPFVFSKQPQSLNPTKSLFFYQVHTILLTSLHSVKHRSTTELCVFKYQSRSQDLAMTVKSSDTFVPTTTTVTTLASANHLNVPSSEDLHGNSSRSMRSLTAAEKRASKRRLLSILNHALELLSDSDDEDDSLSSDCTTSSPSRQE